MKKETSIFEDLDRPKLNPQLQPYWDDGITLEPYYEDNKLKEIISIGKKTCVPMTHDGFKAIAQEFLSWGSDKTRRELIEERMQQPPCWGWNFL